MQKAIIVGATSGMGRALALKFAEEGYRVGIIGRRVDLLDELVQHNPSAFYAVAEDITNQGSIAALSQLTRELGGLDLLVMAAGYGAPYKPLDHNVTVDVIRTNILGFTKVVDWGLQFFQDQGYGQLVAFTSIAGLRGNALDPGYCASKAFQINYLEGMRHTMDQYKLPVYITEIRPGFVEKKGANVEKRFWVDSLDRATLRIYRGIQRQRNVVYLSSRWILISLAMQLIPRTLYLSLMRGYGQPDSPEAIPNPRSIRPPRR